MTPVSVFFSCYEVQLGAGVPSYLTEDKLLSLTCDLTGLFSQTSELRVVGKGCVRAFNTQERDPQKDLPHCMYHTSSINMLMTKPDDLVP